MVIDVLGVFGERVDARFSALEKSNGVNEKQEAL